MFLACNYVDSVYFLSASVARRKKKLNNRTHSNPRETSFVTVPRREDDNFRADEAERAERELADVIGFDGIREFKKKRVEKKKGKEKTKKKRRNI